ncbi:cupredoxin domain-containing protein [Natrarchaeobaculum aegyptiacum]|uniref:PKD domain-containing protein n=1 Tax=Natrarchaeobaculum aegyptiacum TaxID=745377 RepID=A0A2Z2HV22_9EURY|nr:PKD domain-containing protein [Natrarchaeobaculum aegyptiacum]ARS91052.1 PKD domain-containing protein [Natrarchaeobaculum aegyptiacum]
MSWTSSIDRRTLLTAASAAGLTFLAGCPDDEEEPDDDEPDDDEPEEVDLEEWEDVDEFYFEGRTEAWVGIEPEIIEDEENPTITLIEGQEYDFRWVNGDGVTHNLEIRDDGDEIIDDYQSEDVTEEGEETTLEGVTATEEMVTYICTYHEATQVGDITVESE